MNQTIYFIHNKRNNKYYVGRSSDPKRRFRDHMCVPTNDLIREDMERYGKESFELIETVFTELPVYAAKLVEECLIVELKTFIPTYGYNIRIGDKDPRTAFDQIRQVFREWFET